MRITATNAVGPTTTSHGGGLGLLGMAERASVLGGSLRHGVRDGRFELEAVLPVVDVVSGPTVLIADDQDLVRSGLEMVVAARGCEVVGTAGDGREAVRLVRELAPDVVLMDIRMPVLDGIAATRAIVARGSRPGAGADDVRRRQPTSTRRWAPGRRGSCSRRPRRTGWSRASTRSPPARRCWRRR